MPWQFVDTPWLRVAHEDHHPNGRGPIVLMHGWPDSTRTWQGVTPLLVAAGWRVIVPALRGFGPTQFLKPDTPRSGQLAALGRDLLEFIDAKGLQKPVLVGHDWGARAVANACGLRPGVASHLVLLSSGYGTNTADQALTLEQVRNYWYHWFMATPRGQKTVRQDGKAFAQVMWDTWAPAGWYDPAEFEATALAFDNPDWPEVTLHSYTHRWGHAPGNPVYEQDDLALNPAPVLDVPTLMLHGQADGVNPPASSEGKAHYFKGRYERHVLPEIGHFPQREAPGLIAEHLLRFLA